MSRTLRMGKLLLVGIALFAAWSVTAFADEPSIHDDFKKVREELLLKGSTAPFIKEHGADRIDAWKAAAEKGSAEAQWLLSRCYTLGVGVKEDLAEAVRWMQKAADQALSLAQNNLGNIYENGLGVETDAGEAREICTRSRRRRTIPPASTT